MDELKADEKSAAWKLALAAMLKPRATAKGLWLCAALSLGNLHGVGRKVDGGTRTRRASRSARRWRLPQTPQPP